MFIYKITKLKIKNFSKSKAFTLIELLIVIGITAIIAAIGIGYYGGSFKTKILDTTVQEITTYLRYAQRKSMSREQGLQWGVHFENPVSGQDFYALFNGSTYSNPIETKYLPKEIEFLAPENGSSTDIVFQKLTGFLSGSTYQQIILKEISTNQTKNVLACYQGLISFNTDISVCGEVGGIDTTPPIIVIGEITVSNKAYGNYVSSPFDLSAEITDNKGGIKSCEYTTNGRNWYHAYLSGTGPYYTCTKTITAPDASTLTLNMRATSARGTGVGSPITKTVDISPPSDGTLTATLETQQIQLSWYDFSDNGSGLATENTYKLVYLNNDYPAVNCTNGTQIYLGADTSYTHTGTLDERAYFYRVCAYDALGNISNGAIASTTPSVVDHRRPITIDNSSNSNTLTDYQILLSLDTSALISANKMRSDCGDVRFKDSDDSTSLSYWLESDCNTTTTKIWVKVPSIPASSSKTIYLHYGNLSDTSQSSETNVFYSGSVEALTSYPTSTWGTGSKNPSDTYNTYYHDSRNEMIFQFSHFAAGSVYYVPLKITGIQLQRYQAPGRSLVDYRIRYQLTTATTISSFTASGWNLIYGPTTHTPASDWNTYDTTDFYWTSDNLRLDLSRDGVGYTSGGGMYRRTGLPSNVICTYYSDSKLTWPFDSGSCSVGTFLPTIAFNGLLRKYTTPQPIISVGSEEY